MKTWVKSCQDCQRAKIHRHTRPPITPFADAAGRFETVHIDLIGPLPEQSLSQSSFSLFRYVLTCIDRAARWVEAAPLLDISAETVARTFPETWIARFCVPVYVVTDRGRQFEAELFEQLARFVGFHRMRISAYHAQAIGMLERRHRVIKGAIMARRQEWLAALPVVRLGIRIPLA